MRMRFNVNMVVVVVAVPSVGVKVVVEVTASALFASIRRAAFVYGHLRVILPAFVTCLVVVQTSCVVGCVDRVLRVVRRSTSVPGSVITVASTRPVGVCVGTTVLEKRTGGMVVSAETVVMTTGVSGTTTGAAVGVTPLDAAEASDVTSGLAVFATTVNV